MRKLHEEIRHDKHRFIDLFKRMELAANKQHLHVDSVRRIVPSRCEASIGR